jgi:hypothetical protein
MSRSFDGTGDELAGTITAASGAQTIAVWFKATSLGNFREIFKLREGAGEGQVIKMMVMASGNLRGQIDQGGAQAQFDVAGVLTDGTWQCAVMRTNGSNAHKIFLDGASATNSTTASPTGMDEVRIGSTYIGLEAHAARWDTALSDGDAASLIAGANPLAVSAASLLNYWPLTSNTSPEPDDQGSNDLTVTDATYSADDPTVDAPPGGEETVLGGGAAGITFVHRFRR